MRSRVWFVLCALLLPLLAAAPLFFSTQACAAETRGTGGIRAIILTCEKWGTNYSLLRDEMELHGWELVVTGAAPSVNPCPWSAPLGNTAMATDGPLSTFADLSDYDALIVMPATAWQGDSHAQLLGSPEALDLVTRASGEGLLVSSFCGGARVLAAAGVIAGRHVTGHANYVQEYVDAGAIYVGNPVAPVLDGNILTCVRTQYYCRQFVERAEAVIDSLRAARSGVNGASSRKE